VGSGFVFPHQPQVFPAFYPQSPAFRIWVKFQILSQSTLQILSQSTLQPSTCPVRRHLTGIVIPNSFHWMSFILKIFLEFSFRLKII
jgi:hypothetical protein